MKAVDQRPKVSVIIPAYNPGPMIVEAIESVLRQTVQDLEIIVVDDASSDDVNTYLRSFGGQVRYFRQGHGGPSVARNRGMLLARGQYVAFLDADDLWLPQKLEKQLPLLEDHDHNVLVYCDFYKSASPDSQQESGLASRKHWRAGDEFQSLLRQNFIHTSSVLIRKDALAQAGLFDPKLTSGEDLDLWIRLAEVGKIGFVNEILTFYRVHENQSVNTLQFARSVIYTDRVLLARLADNPQALKSIKAKAGHDLTKLGRRELRQGNFEQARRAFWQASKFGGQRFGSLAKWLYCILPGPIIHSMRNSREQSR